MTKPPPHGDFALTGWPDGQSVSPVADWLGSSSHRAEYLGERGRAGTEAGDDGVVSCGDPVSDAGGTGRCVAAAEGGGHPARRRGGSRRERGALFARPGRQWRGTVLGSPDCGMAAHAGWQIGDVYEGTRSRRAARSREVIAKVLRFDTRWEGSHRPSFTVFGFCAGGVLSVMWDWVKMICKNACSTGFVAGLLWMASGGVSGMGLGGFAGASSL